MVLLQQEAFSRSLNDILLLHAAIRYAGIKGKTVTITPYTSPEVES
jgi:hypothetical protein